MILLKYLLFLTKEFTIAKRINVNYQKVIFLRKIINEEAISKNLWRERI